MSEISEELRQKFEHNVLITPGCWLWQGAKNSVGYGVFSCNGENVLTHRFAFELYIAPIPYKLHVLHRCDVRNCVNPVHLFAGTNAMNMLDKALKGRCKSPQGAAHGSRKLNPDQVRAIRADNRLHHEIAEDYGIAPNHVWMIKARRFWKNLD